MNTVQNIPMRPWRPMFWEPVAGTGERLMVGVVYEIDGCTQATRILRDDVLDSLYGRASTGARKLIETALDMCVQGARAGGLAALDVPVMGLHPGPMRCTEAVSAGDLLRTAALLYSSLAGIDKLDELEEADAPQAEEVNRRFSTEVRELVVQQRPDLAQYFNRGGTLIDGGQSVRFGYFSPRAVVHFSVLHPVRQSASVRDARARLWELHRAVTVAGVQNAALITAVPRPDDATLGERQRTQARDNEREIEREADAANIRLHPVYTAEQGAVQLIESVA